MNRLVLFFVIIFISGCCTLAPTYRKCECKEVYNGIEKHIIEYVDTASKIAPRYILNSKNKPVYEIYSSIEKFIKQHKNCLIGQRKSKIIELLGKPDSDFYADYLKRRNFTYTITVQHKNVMPKNIFTISVIYDNDYKEKISEVIAGGVPFMIKIE